MKRNNTGKRLLAYKVVSYVNRFHLDYCLNLVYELVSTDCQCFIQGRGLPECSCLVEGTQEYII